MTSHIDGPRIDQNLAIGNSIKSLLVPDWAFDVPPHTRCWVVRLSRKYYNDYGLCYLVLYPDNRRTSQPENLKTIVGLDNGYCGPFQNARYCTN